MAAGESGAGERKKKRTPDTITARVVCRPLFAYAMLSCVMLLMLANQILSEMNTAWKALILKVLKIHSIKCHEQIYDFKCQF